MPVDKVWSVPVEVLVMNPTAYEAPLSQDVVVTNPVITIQEPLDVVVTNPVDTVTVSNFPDAAPEAAPAVSDIVSGSRTSTGTLYTVPAGRVFRGSVALSACVAVAGASAPTISTTDGEIHRITLNGLALSSISVANNLSDVYIDGGAGGKAITFTQGAAGTSTGQVAGRLL